MWWKPSVHLTFLMISSACGSSRSEEVAETPPPSVVTDTGVTASTTDTVVTTRTIVDTTLVTVDTTITGVDTTFAVDTTAIEAGRGEVVDTTP
jgi:hypothetical protein